MHLEHDRIATELHAASAGLLRVCPFAFADRLGFGLLPTLDPGFAVIGGVIRFDASSANDYAIGALVVAAVCSAALAERGLPDDAASARHLAARCYALATRRMLIRALDREVMPVAYVGVDPRATPKPPVSIRPRAASRPPRLSHERPL